MADQDDNKKFVRALRDLADWYENHPTVPRPYAFDHGWTSGLGVYLFDKNEQESKALLREIGSFDKKFHSEQFKALKPIGNTGLLLDFTFYRDRVCTPKVIGTKHVETTVIPETYYPSRVVPAHDEDIIEWNCEPVLAPADEESAPAPEPSTLAADTTEIKF